MEWRDLDSPSSRGWWALEERGERLALLQPFEGRIVIRFYLGIEPWRTRDESAPTIGQAKRFAERWVRARRGKVVAFSPQSTGEGGNGST